MFTGINEKIKKIVAKYNQENSPNLVFSFADLELVETSDERKKCRLLSKELSKKLRKIYLKGKSDYVPPIKFIDFDLDNNLFYIVFPNVLSWSGYFYNYDWWLKLSKEDIQKNSEVTRDGTLRLNFITRGESLLWYMDDYENRNNFCRTKAEESAQIHTSALTQIENTIKNGNIDFITLAGSMLFLEESYIISRPVDCLYCNDPEELEPDRIAKYYETHINKCLWRPDRINEFKDKQVDLIERIINKFNDYKKGVIREIIKKAKKQGISKDELKNNRPNWKNTLRSLTNKEKISEYQTNQLEEDIKKLVEAKNKSAEERQQAEAESKENARKEEEKLKKEREEQERKVKEEKEKREQKQAEERKKQEQEAKKQAAEQAKQQELNQKKEEFISRITAALNQEEYPLTNSNLSPQYQNWEIQISQINELQLITNLQDRLLADIQARRQDKKSAQKVRENLDKVQTGTEEEKKQAWENLEKNETEKGYQDNKEEVEKLKKAKVTENPQEYSEEAKKRITKKLEDNKVKEEELSDENQKHWQKLKGGETISPLQLVNIETKIKENIYQKEAKKKINNLISRADEILNSKSNNKKFQIETLKKELLQFISDGNVYYSAQKTLAESLLAKLENYLITTDENQNIPAKSPFFPWKIIIPFLLVGLLITAILLIRKRKIKK